MRLPSYLLPLYLISVVHSIRIGEAARAEETDRRTDFVTALCFTILS
jgi:superfamily II DNA/RNA helicase